MPPSVALLVGTLRIEFRRRVSCAAAQRTRVHAPRPTTVLQTCKRKERAVLKGSICFCGTPVLVPREQASVGLGLVGSSRCSLRTVAVRMFGVTLGFVKHAVSVRVRR